MKKQKQDMLFNYVSESKPNKKTLELHLFKLYIILLIVMVATTFLISGLIFNKSLMMLSIGNISIVFLLVYIYQKFYLKYDSKTLFAPVPKSTGNVLVKLSANNLQLLAENKKREINGLLVIGDKSIVFVPYKYSFMKRETVQIPWEDITSIYKASGLLVDQWLMRFGFYKRYIYKNTSQIVIETGEKCYYFQALSTEQIIDDLNTFKDSLKSH